MQRLVTKLFFITCFCLFLTGCDTKIQSTTINPTSSPISTETFLANATPSIDNTYSQETLDTSMSTFGISSSDIVQLIYKKDVDSYSKNISGYDIDIFPNGDYIIFCVSITGSDYPILVYAYDQALSGTSTSSENLIQPLLDALPENINVSSGSYNLSNSSRQIVSCVWIEDSSATDFPLTIQLPPDTDYFLFTDIEEYKLACTEGRYADIYADIQSYIENTNPPSYDSAYILQSVLSPIIDDWENIEVQYDPIAKYATFTYSKVTAISNEMHFVPYALSNEKYIHALIGFYNSDWLFFNDIIISSNENIKISASTDKIENVTTNAMIYEAFDTPLHDEAINELLQTPSHIIRFQSQDGSFEDYEMTSEEYEALTCIAKFQNVRNILSDSLFHFQKRIPIALN